MTTATVRYITNGYTVNWSGSQAIGVPASLYAATIPEAVYWLGRIFDPVAQPPALRAEPSPQVVENNDPLLGMEAVVSDIASGGFLVRQQSATLTPRPVETFCANVDAVSDLLTLIFTPPVVP
jgi:hypothetical protein